MNQSTNHTNGPGPGIHEATRALQDLADEVEQERVEHGRSALDPVKLSDGVALADEIAHSDSAPAGEAPPDPQAETLGALPTVPPRMQLPH